MIKRNIYILFGFLLLLSSCITDFEETTNYPYKVGDIYSENGVMGIVYKISEGGLHGMILSFNEIACEWGDTLLTDANDSISGMENMKKIQTQDDWRDKFPAFVWCDDKNKIGVSGWYLPSKLEMEDILEERAILNKVFESIGTEVMFGKMYWTSTEYGKYEAYHGNFLNGEIEYYALKINKIAIFARAVKSF